MVDRKGTTAGYPAWLADVKARSREAGLRASLAVNAELIGLYWRHRAGGEWIGGWCERPEHAVNPSWTETRARRGSSHRCPPTGT